MGRQRNSRIILIDADVLSHFISGGQLPLLPKIFPFPIKRGTRAYTPDFFLVRNNEWIEIKGYLDDKSKIKLKRFKRYYPDEFAKLTCVISKYSNEAKNFMAEIEVSKIVFYEDIRDYYSPYIINWEGKK